MASVSESNPIDHHEFLDNLFCGAVEEMSSREVCEVLRECLVNGTYPSRKVIANAYRLIVEEYL